MMDVYFRTMSTTAKVDARENERLSELMVRMALSVFNRITDIEPFLNQFHPILSTRRDDGGVTLQTIQELCRLNPSRIPGFSGRPISIFSYRDTDLDTADFVLNTVRVIGSPIMRAMARIFGKPDTLVIGAQDRAWIADIIMSGVREGLLDHTAWKTVYRLLQGGRSQTVVVSREAELEKPKLYDGSDEQWNAMGLINPQQRWFDYVQFHSLHGIITPPGVATHIYGHGLTFLDLLMPQEFLDQEFEKNMARLNHSAYQQEEEKF